MMRAELYTKWGERLLAYIYVPCGPVCGIDFCESCEDCMACFYCGCTLIVYEDQWAEFMEHHPDAVVKWGEVPR